MMKVSGKNTSTLGSGAKRKQSLCVCIPSECPEKPIEDIYFLTQSYKSKANLKFKDENEIIKILKAEKRFLIAYERKGNLTSVGLAYPGIILSDLVGTDFFGFRDSDKGPKGKVETEDFLVKFTVSYLKNFLHLMNNKLYHSDVNPCNILVKQDGSTYLIDVILANYFPLCENAPYHLDRFKHVDNSFLNLISDILSERTPIGKNFTQLKKYSYIENVSVLLNKCERDNKPLDIQGRLKIFEHVVREHYPDIFARNAALFAEPIMCGNATQQNYAPGFQEFRSSIQCRP